MKKTARKPAAKADAPRKRSGARESLRDAVRAALRSHPVKSVRSLSLQDTATGAGHIQFKHDAAKAAKPALEAVEAA